MKSPSSRDLELLSAYLDGQLSQSRRARLEIRIKADPALAGSLADLRQTRALLRRTPQRRAPRNFTLTPRMAGLRPPVPRAVPVLSWASAVAMLFFIFTLGAGLVGQLSFGAASRSAAPMGAGPALAAPAPMAAPAMAAPATLAPATKGLMLPVPATQAPVPTTSSANSSNPPAAGQAMSPTPTEQVSATIMEQATPPAVSSFAQPTSARQALPKPVNTWLFIWPGLAVLLAAAAILVFWLNKRTFQRKNPPG